MPRIPHTSPQTLRLFDALLGDPTRWRYGYDLSRETGLASGTLYPILMRLAAQRLLDTGWEPADDPGRPPRHTYRLTADGAALARERLATRMTTAAARAGRTTTAASPGAGRTTKATPPPTAGAAPAHRSGRTPRASAVWVPGTAR